MTEGPHGPGDRGLEELLDEIGVEQRATLREAAGLRDCPGMEAVEGTRGARATGAAATTRPRGRIWSRLGWVAAAALVLILLFPRQEEPSQLQSAELGAGIELTVDAAGPGARRVSWQLSTRWEGASATLRVLDPELRGPAAVLLERAGLRTRTLLLESPENPPWPDPFLVELELFGPGGQSLDSARHWVSSSDY